MYKITREEWKRIHRDYKSGTMKSAKVMGGSLPDRLYPEVKKNGDQYALVPVEVVKSLDESANVDTTYDLETIILETLYEMIKSGDKNIIALMQESEKTFVGVTDSSNDEWVQDTLHVIKESLNERGSTIGSQTSNTKTKPVISEITKMLNLISYKSEG